MSEPQDTTPRDADSTEQSDVSASEASGDGSVLDELLLTVESLRVERDSYLDTAQRIQAEFDNYRKRSASDVDDRIKGGLARMAESLLPVLDAFDAAIGQGDSSAEPLRSQLFAVLEREGLALVGAAGEPFDPTVHEAVLHEPGDGGESVVVEELRPGYRWHGRVLRAAMVKVRD